MALVLKDRVKETTSTTGTGAISLGGAVANFQAFSAVLSDADTTYYAIIDVTNSDYEVGLGTYASSGNTLARTTILESSNGGSAVSFGAGSKNVFIAYPAEKSVYLDASDQLVINGTAVTSTPAELNILDGVTATTAELNYTDGVTSNIQTQLDSKVGANYTGDVDITGDVGITGELLVDSYNETFKKVSSVVSYTGYQLGSASYNQNFSVSSQDNIPLDVAFNSDGTKMFVVGNTNDSVYEYDLSTAFDISTASYSQSFSVTSQDVQPYGLDFNTDGTKMFILGGNNDAVFEYDLSTGFDISTASYSQNFSLTSQSSSMIGQGFSPDGTRMYTIDVTSDAVWQYNLSTAFDISTASYIRNFSVAAQDTSPHDVTFNDDGTKMYVVGNVGDDIIEYALTTGFEINTASYVQNLAVSSQDASPVAVKFNNDGTKMFVVGESGDQILEYYTRVASYSTTFDCENANVFETELDANTTVVFNNPPASGTPVTTSYDIANASYASKSFSIASQETSPGGVDFSSDGTKMYVVGFATDTVYEYDLSTAWDASTASYNSVSFLVSSQETVPQSVRLADSGTKMYIVGQTNNTVYQYTLSTAYDLSTASYASKSFSVASQETAACCLFFKSDGTEMYVAGTANDTVYQYTLSTAFDVSTASYSSKNVSIASQDSIPGEIAFTSDGTKMFMVGVDTDIVYQYSLSTAWDISTASYDSVSFSVASQETVPAGLAFKSDGTTMYILGQTNDTVYQYTTSTSSLNDSTAYAMSLQVVQDSGASGYTVTWPTSVDWPAATAPTLTATASAVDQFVFYTYDGGTTWYGFTAGQALG